MKKSSCGDLIYRASRDGFTSQEFHSKCDNKENTITIIKNNLDYVFGGFIRKGWNSNAKWVNDENAFIFSLRRNGISNNEKFAVKNAKKFFCGWLRYLDFLIRCV